MELSRKREDSEIKQDDDKLATLDRTLDASAGRMSHHEQALREKFEKKLDASEEAFAHKLKQQEQHTEEQGTELLKDFADKMAKSEVKRRPATSYLQTGEDTAAGGKDASTLAAARVEAQARQAAQARLGSEMHDLLAQFEAGAASRKEQLAGDRDEAHKKLAAVTAGLKAEELKLKASEHKGVAKRAALEKRMAAGDKGFEKKLHAHEAAFVAKEADMRASFAAKYKDSDAAFNKREHDTEQVLKDAFNFRGN